jgi:HPt (histidine-containing phosphotransfer) domain-containing protein
MATMQNRAETSDLTGFKTAEALGASDNRAMYKFQAVSGSQTALSTQSVFSSASVPDVDPVAIERLYKWGGTRLVRIAIQLFLEHSLERIGHLSTALAARDLEAIRRGAHSMKSTAAQLGLEGLRMLATALEQAAENSDYDVVEQLAPSLEPLYLQARVYLEGCVC